MGVGAGVEVEVGVGLNVAVGSAVGLGVAVGVGSGLDVAVAAGVVVSVGTGEDCGSSHAMRNATAMKHRNLMAASQKRLRPRWQVWLEKDPTRPPASDSWEHRCQYITRVLATTRNCTP